MGKKSLTKDETCLLRMQEQGGKEKLWHEEEIAKLAGTTTRRTATMLKELTQANFLRKHRDGSYQMTDRGERLVEELGE